MSNFVHFDAPFRFVDLKNGFSLYRALENIPTHTDQCSRSRNPCINLVYQDGSKFVEKVVSTVKQTHFTTHQQTCHISLEALLNSSFLQPPFNHCQFPQTKHLTAIAQMLYHSYGIEVREVDDMESPHIMVVAWHRDNLRLNQHPPI